MDRMTSKFLAVIYKVLFGLDADNTGPVGDDDVFAGDVVEFPFKLDELVVLAPDKWSAGPTATTCI